MSDTVIVVATFVPAAGQFDAVAAVLADVAGEVHAEPGCELYALHTGEGELVLVEKWASRDALDVHLAGAALARLVTGVGDRLSEPFRVQVLTPRPAGDSARATV